MKTFQKFSLSLLLAALSPLLLSAQDAAFQVGYILNQPGTYMRHTMPQAHLFHLGFAIPFHNAPQWEYGFELNMGGYGKQVTDQLYTFQDGSTLMAPVTVRNTFGHGGLMLRYTVPTNSAVSPFAVVRGGMARMATRLTISDPRESHTDDCPQPLENDLLQSAIGFTYGAGIGVKVDMGRIFNGLEHDRYFLNFHADYLRGTPMEYMSVNAPSALQLHTGEGVESVTLPFASNAQPSVTHRYHSGYLYRTRLEMMQFGVQFMVRF